MAEGAKLTVHRGAQIVTREELKNYPAPEPTDGAPLGSRRWNSLNPWARRGVALVLFAQAAPLAAEIPLYQNGSEFRLDLGIRAQIQYYHLGGEDWSEEKLYFRRLRPVLNARFSPRWEAEAEFDFGETVEGEAVEFKDMVVSYLGWEARGFTLSLGNDKAVFSRQLQSSSKRLTLVERGLVGIDDFGSLDRVLGARVDGIDPGGRFRMAGSVGLASSGDRRGRCAATPAAAYVPAHDRAGSATDACAGYRARLAADRLPNGRAGSAAYGASDDRAGLALARGRGCRAYRTADSASDNGAARLVLVDCLTHGRPGSAADSPADCRARIAGERGMGSRETHCHHRKQFSCSEFGFHVDLPANLDAGRHAASVRRNDAVNSRTNQCILAPRSVAGFLLWVSALGDRSVDRR